ncbi:PREDICTED: protein BPS1, chloroplastic-like [Ipomoea nil]|uniref:protein BPS1, chloroplastic-like n=1 Tax=Ipomoea nil TaxID=35883 RepID=UPI000900BFD6|nr:PREDICTED: protein BPS1, chloroplastic-like [Ipomoea nil]
MSRPQEPHRPFFSFGNPLRMILPKGSHLSPRLISLLKSFEESLAGKLKSLIPGGGEDVISLLWMQQAIVSLSQIHIETKELITALEFPVSDWDEKWIDVYLDNSVRLLDICTSISSEITRINQANLFLSCAVHYLEGEEKQIMQACSSLNGWRQHMNSQNPRLERCFEKLNTLTESLNLPKIKNSAKGKVLMQALYGVRMVTIFICSVFAVAFSGSVGNLKELEVLETCLWADAYVDLQGFINREMRNIYSSGAATALKDLEAIHASVEKLHPIIQDGVNPIGADVLPHETSGLAKMADRLSKGLDGLAKEVDGFFQIVLTGRDALLCNLRIGSNNASPSQENNAEQPTLR